jgi:hypothetical protein
MDPPAAYTQSFAERSYALLGVRNTRPTAFRILFEVLLTSREQKY